MPARKSSKRNASKKRRVQAPRTPFAMLVQFQQMRLRKALKRARDEGNCLGCGNDLAPPPSGPSSIAMIPGWIVHLVVRMKWCMDAERALESGIKLLQEHGDEMTEKQREDLRNDLAELLGYYGDIC